MNKKTCGAKTRSGAPCKRASSANGRCNLHGGKSLSGVASPRFSSGRYSKYLPVQLLSRFLEAQTDGALLELRDELALIDARIVDVLGRVDNGESGSLWLELERVCKEFDRAKECGDSGAVVRAGERIVQVVSRGHSDSEAWREVLGLVERRRKLVESERKRMVEAGQMVSVEQAMVLVCAIGDSVRRNVQDRTALAAISADIRRLTSTGT